VSAEGSPPRRKRALSVGYSFFLAIGIIALTLANLLVWLERTVLNTAAFVATTSSVLDEPAVEQRIANVMTARVVESTDLGARVAERLPSDLEFAAPIAERQLEALLTNLALAVLRSEASANARETLVARLHSRVLATLEGDTEYLRVNGDRLVVDLRPPLELLFERLRVAPPEALQRPDFAQIVIVRDSRPLQRAARFIQARDELLATFGTISIAAFVLTILVARDRSRALQASGFAVIAVGVVTLAAVFLSNLALETGAEERIVLRGLIGAFERDLKVQSAILGGVGALMVAAVDPRVRGYVHGVGQRSREGLRAFGVVPSLLVASALLLFVLIAV